MPITIASRHQQFLSFLLVGGTAAAFNILSRVVLSVWLPYPVAIVLAFTCSCALAFCLNRIFVFRDAVNTVSSQATWFLIVNLGALLLTFSVSMLLARVLLPAIHFAWHAEFVAHAIGVAAPVFTSYVAHQKLSFRRT
jgi:putative flippase GtrA